MGKVGSQSNPIKLVPDVGFRELLAETTGIGVEDEGAVIAFSKMKEPKQSFDLYVKNLMRNPSLTAVEMRLGFLLFDLLENEYFEAFFLLVVETRFRMSSVGENGILYLHDKRQVKTGIELLEKQSLLEIARKANIDVDTRSLITALNRLHSFFYISCTEISEVNTAENRSGYDYGKHETLLGENTKIVHIRLNERLAKYDLTKKWRQKG